MTRAEYHARWQRVNRYGLPPEGLPLRKCDLCGAEFQPTQKKSKFCSSACRVTTMSRRLRATRKWRSGSPEKFIGSLLSFYGRRKTLSVEYMLAIWTGQDGKCAISGEPMTHRLGEGHVGTNASIDKIDPDGGYMPGNVRFVCRDVNSMRQRLSDDELLMWCHKVINHMQKVKQ